MANQLNVLETKDIAHCQDKIMPSILHSAKPYLTTNHVLKMLHPAFQLFNPGLQRQLLSVTVVVNVLTALIHHLRIRESAWWFRNILTSHQNLKGAAKGLLS